MALPDVLTTPEGVAVVTGLVMLGVWWQKSLSWYEYRTVHGLKRAVFPALDAWATRRGRPLINEKGYRTDAEYLRTCDRSVRDVWTELVASGGDPHLISALKRRPLPNDGSQLSAAHVVWLHDDGTQTEAYLFDAPEGGTDVYAHHEDAVTDPVGHLTDGQTDADPRGVVTAALASA